jgi:hypothetical protein
LLILLVLLLASPLVAQDPIPPADTLAADSLAVAPDSSSTERLLAVEGQSRVLLNPLPTSGLLDLLPPGARTVFTRDSIDWMPAHTVSELLVGLPGVFLWRGEWRGRAEMPSLRARGAGAIEYFMDGVPHLAVGPDSVGIDPSLFSLDLFERIEVVRLPGMMRVYLVTRRHDRQAPRTRIGVSTGDRGLARYSGSFEQRFVSGIGLSLAGDYFSVNAPEGGTGGGGVTNGWGQLSWQINPSLGAQAQLMVQSPDRDVLLRADGSLADTLDVGRRGTRSDAQFRLSWRSSESSSGWSADGFANRTTWSGQGIRHDVGSYGAVLGLRRPTISVQSRIFHHTEWTPLDARVSVGWAPVNGLSGALEGVYQQHDGDRTSSWATARTGFTLPRSTPLLLGLRFPVTLELGLAATHGERVDAPAMTDAIPQSFTDYEATASVGGSFAGVSATLTSTDAWQPSEFPQFARIASFGAIPRTEWLGVRARITPTNWFTLSSAYDNPMGGAMPEGNPPHHAWTTATISSRFLRNFPSGIFRLKVQGVLESWSPGVIGRDREGAAISMPGLTFVRGTVQLQIGPFIAYWDRVNFQATDRGQVPGYPIFSLGSSYGIRWEFTN